MDDKDKETAGKITKSRGQARSRDQSLYKKPKPKVYTKVKGYHEAMDINSIRNRSADMEYWRPENLGHC